MTKKLIIIFFLAFLVRLISLNQSLWLDEGTTARVVSQYNFSEIISQFSRYDFHPPLYYFVMKLWTNVFGYSEIALRFPSILFSLLAGWFVYLIGKKIKNHEAGFWAAAFFLFNPLIVYYSQEARMYMMVTFFITVLLYCSIALLLNKKTRTLTMAVANLSIFLSLYTFYGSIFFIAALFLLLLFQKRFRLLFLLLPGTILVLVILTPLLLLQLENAKQTLQVVANWSAVLGTVTMKNLLLIPMKFSTGRISFEPKLLFYAISLLWTIIVFFFVARGSRKYRSLLVLLILPVILGLVFSFFSPLLQYFRFLYLIPLFSLLLAFGTKDVWQRYLLLGGFLTFSFAYLLIPQFHREDWKELTRILSKNSEVYMIPSVSDPLRYYHNDVVVKDIHQLDSDKKTIVVFPYTVEIYGYDYRSELTKRNFFLKKTSTSRGVFFEEWQRN
ncbi:glycosyltransferase family 39 protein [Candidatus Roizmanbacteria bacterium]|nr:glycosyltransferase family 39 protein [Candidatus Roizmanbacteria bacterium]